MKLHPSLIAQSLALLTACLCASTAVADEDGFVPLLDRDHTDGWRQCGEGEMKITDGVSFNTSHGKLGVAWYTKRMFSNFILKAEFKGAAREFNSGIWLRFSDPQGDMSRLGAERYEVAISHMLKRDPWPTGSIYDAQRCSVDALRPDDWNEFEITVVGQEYTVRLNGKKVNQFIGTKALTGYIGLEENAFGPVQFRNVRIKELGGASPAIAGTAAAIQTDPNQPRIEVLKEQAPNAIEWALAPLDQAVPGDIRQNLTFLREDLLDEGKQKPKASATAYTLGSQLCNAVLAILEERTQTQSRAGFRAVEANARTGVTSEALEARRDYKMSWPQFARENAQRAELKSQAVNNAAVMAERPKADWVARTTSLRKPLDTLYAQFRDAIRQSTAAK